MNNKLFLFYTIIIIVLTNVIGYAQISFPGKPKKNVENFERYISFVTIHPSDIRFKDENLNHTKPSRFADQISVYYTPANSGKWDNSGAFTNIWRLGICSPDASSLGILFDRFRLCAGVKVFIYSSSGSEVYGAFTYRNNNKKNLLAITPVNNDSLIIEMQVMKGINEFGNLEISQIGVGFPLKDFQKSTSDRWFGTSADCHVNVNCLIDKQLSVYKNSVCKIIYNNTSRCTGTLINNTENNGRPLVLTAAHCISNDKTASSALFFFNYESPYCENSDVPSKSLSGSRLLATNEFLDFSLLELNDNVPADYQPVFAGWDRTTNSFSRTTTFHHPEGDIKKVSVNYDPILDGSTFDPYYYGYWLLQNYEIGSSEAGSSGSALFDSVFHIRGTLTSGNQVCQSIIDDYYARFDRSWNYYPDSTRQLAHWLDPHNISVPALNSFIPSDPLLEYSEQLSNVKSGDSLLNDKMTDGSGYITGSNSSGNKEYAEHFYCNGSKYIYALKIKVAKAIANTNTANVIFKIWRGTEKPEKIIFHKEVLLFELLDNDTNLIRLDSSVYVNQNFFVGYEIQDTYKYDTFAVYYSDPLFKVSKNTAFVKLNNKWQPLSNGVDSLNTSMAIFPLVFNYYVNENSEPGKFPLDELTVYPNPAIESIQLLFKDKPEGIITCKIYDLSGRIVKIQSISDIEPNYLYNINDLDQGVYILKIFTQDKTLKTKFVKLN